MENLQNRSSFYFFSCTSIKMSTSTIPCSMCNQDLSAMVFLNHVPKCYRDTCKKYGMIPLCTCDSCGGVRQHLNTSSTFKEEIVLKSKSSDSETKLLPV